MIAHDFQVLQVGWSHPQLYTQSRWNSLAWKGPPGNSAFDVPGVIAGCHAVHPGSSLFSAMYPPFIPFFQLWMDWFKRKTENIFTGNHGFSLIKYLQILGVFLVIFFPYTNRYGQAWPTWNAPRAATWSRWIWPSRRPWKMGEFSAGFLNTWNPYETHVKPIWNPWKPRKNAGILGVCQPLVRPVEISHKNHLSDLIIPDHFLLGKAKCDPWAEDKRSLEFKGEGWDGMIFCSENPSLTYWCLYSREWMGMGVAGMIITYYYLRLWIIPENSLRKTHQ